MKIIKAAEEQYTAVRAFYHSIIDALKGDPYDLGWKKDIYPGPDFLMESIRKGELYIATEDGNIVASMVFNHDCNDSYNEFTWPTDAKPDEVSVIHALAVSKSHGRKGIGRQMVGFAIDMAEKNGQKAIRLDVIKGNLPAEKLYLGMGFRKLHTLQMFYENVGWTDFGLYEYKI
ncbi:MAG: GNAT family N-acetyltransferase [Clostridia bacterium]|nr:GNAT family N-acetyltransferase [Clostridia bacterium]